VTLLLDVFDTFRGLHGGGQDQDLHRDRNHFNLVGRPHPRLHGHDYPETQQAEIVRPLVQQQQEQRGQREYQLWFEQEICSGNFEPSRTLDHK